MSEKQDKIDEQRNAELIEYGIQAMVTVLYTVV